MADTDYERVVEQTHRLAESMSKAEKSASGVQSVFGSLFRQLVGAEVLGNVIRDMVRNSRVVLTVQQALSGENLNKLRLVQREIQLDSDIAKAERRKLSATGAQLELVDRRLAYLRGELELLQKQKVVNMELEKLSRLELGYMALMGSAAASMWFNARQFNQNLIEANSSWEHRDRLIRQTLLTQAQLGISFDEITKSAAALVRYGMDTEATFDTNLRLVSQLEQGLGVSVDQSAQLASIVERQVRGSFEQVSHVISQIVNDTALAGDEAARLAINISTALGRLRPGMSAATLPEVVRLVGRYESALKEVGGQSGAFQQLLTQLTTPEGLVGAGALGVNPEFLATTQGVEHVMDRFAKYGQMLVGQSQGWERQMRLQALAQIFNVTTDQANQMLIAIKRAQAAQGTSISTQERWREQLNATNSGITRLANALMGLLQGAMYPVVFIVGALANRLADAVQWLLQSKEVVYTIGIALLAGTIIVTARLWGLVRALTAVALSSTVAQAALSRTAAASTAAGTSTVLGSVGSMLRAILPTGAWFAAIGTQLTWMRLHLFSGGSFATITTGIRTALMNLTTTGAGILRPLVWIVRGVSFLATTAGLLITAFLAAGAVLWKIYGINKQSREDNLAAQKIILSKQEAWESARRARLYAAARYGEAGDVEAIYKRLATAASGMFQDIADPNQRKARQQAWLDEQLASAQADIDKAMTTRTMFTPIIERTPEELRRSEDMKALSQKLLKVNEDQKGILETRRKDALEARQEEANERAKLKWYMPSFYWDFYSRIGEK